MSKVVIGFDLGIASTGYSVMLVEKDGKITLLERGSHLFKTLSNPKTLNSPGGYGEGERGIQRRARRTIRRRQQRRKDFIRLVNDYRVKDKIVSSKYSSIFNFDAEEIKKQPYPIYELSVKGLENELTPQELFKVLYAKLSFRGVSYNLPGENLEKPLAIELLEIFKKNNKIRTPQARGDLLKFSLERNRKDIKKIIDNCSYLKNTNFLKDYLSIFNRVRDFAKGAGSEKSRTNGGIYKKTLDANGNLITLKNMWEESIGKCPVFVQEFRSLKCQSLPEIANLLSQLNSIKYKNNNSIFFLTEKQKQEIIIEVIKKFESPTPNRISKIIGIDKGILYGYPTSKDKTKHNLEKCENLIRLFKKRVLIFKDWETTLDEIKQTDKIFAEVLIHFYHKDEIINANKNHPQSIIKVKEADKNKVINNYEGFCCLNPNQKQMSEDKVLKSLEDFQKNNISGTHTFSLNAVEKYINKNISTQKTLSTFYGKEVREFQENEYQFSKYSKYINNRLMDSVEFISPNIKNAVSETCKIFNKILKKYIYNGPKYILDALIIETTSDAKYALNGMQNNKEIIKIQTQNDKLKADIRREYPGIKESTIEKIILLKEQDDIDLYDRKPIHAEDVINNPESFEIDHILPFSRTQMNDRTNKVLTKSSNNQYKGNKTPVEWLSGKAEFAELKTRWESIFEKENPTKLRNLLLENLSSDLEKKFIARNLTETQYIMRRINIGFQSWKKFIYSNHPSLEVKNQISNFDILTVSGSATQRLRSSDYLNLEIKDRNESAEHHSIDASICAALGTTPEFRESMKSLTRKIDNETGEIKWEFPNQKPKNIFDHSVISKERWNSLGSIIKDSKWLLSYKYMTKLDKYNNISDKLKAINNLMPEQQEKPYTKWLAPKISGETIYGWVEHNGSKHEKKRFNLLDLKDAEIKELNQIFEKTYQESLCLNPKNYFNALQKIWLKYYIDDKQNPFIDYMNEHSVNDVDFQKSKQINNVKLMDGKLDASISRITFIGDQPTIGLDLSHKIAKNAYMSKLAPKCIYIIKDQNGKEKFLKEDWLNSGQKLLADNKWEIIDIIEINTLYKYNNNLFRVSGFNLSGNRITLMPIQGFDKEIAAPYSSFLKMNLVKANKIYK